MTRITAEAAFDRLAQALDARARALAEAAATAAALKARSPDRAWRRAGLLWPLFTKG